MAEVAMYMKDRGSWTAPDIALWFLVAFPTVIGAYEWLGWRYAKLAVRKQPRRPT
jgi:hypothetical protein